MTVSSIYYLITPLISSTCRFYLSHAPFAPKSYFFLLSNIPPTPPRPRMSERMLDGSGTLGYAGIITGKLSDKKAREHYFKLLVTALRVSTEKYLLLVKSDAETP